jgi:hypothetical protein
MTLTARVPGFALRDIPQPSAAIYPTPSAPRAVGLSRRLPPSRVAPAVLEEAAEVRARTAEPVAFTGASRIRVPVFRTESLALMECVNASPDENVKPTYRWIGA